MCCLFNRCRCGCWNSGCGCNNNGCGCGCGSNSGRLQQWYAVPTTAVAATELTEQDLTMVTLSATETDLMQLPTTAVAATADAAATVDAAAQCRLMMEAAAAITN